jgi:hypothetical protein
VFRLKNLGIVRTIDIRRPDGQLCYLFSKISLKFFPELSRVWTVLPCLPDGRTFTARNFHIKALPVRTIGMIVRTVDLMQAISIYVARASGTWGLASGRLNFECATCLMMSASGREFTSSELLQRSSHICILERNLIANWTLSGVRTYCWNVLTDASWSSSKFLDIKEGPGGKFSSSGWMMLWTVGRPDGISCRLDGCKESNFSDL